MPPSNPFADPLQSSTAASGGAPFASSSGSASNSRAHLRQRSLTARTDSLPQSDLGHDMTLTMGGPGAFLMRHDDGPSSRASSLYGDHDGSSSNSHLPFAGSGAGLGQSESKYALSQDVGVYGGVRGRDGLAKEEDDYLHDQPSTALPREGRARLITETSAFRGHNISRGRILNVCALVVLAAGLIVLFIALPVLTFYKAAPEEEMPSIVDTNEGVLMANAPLISNRSLIDPDTPRSAFTKEDYMGNEMKLVFSDEFNVDGRYFYPGEDPFWTAVDFHYWGTNNLEWADPDNIWTEGGHLNLMLTKESLADSHNMGYLGGMLQSWNKFCFTGGRIEVAVSLPGDTEVLGLWPAAWMLGNLGRAGYGGANDGTWPYTYDSCDVGTLANQTDPATGGPAVVTTEGDPYKDFSLSYLPGQKLSRCTCPGEDHPGPFKDGEFTGRGAAEIDIFEALVLKDQNLGEISMSGQWAPFDPSYEYDNSTTDQAEFFDTTFETYKNTYLGGVYQQVTSGLGHTNASTYNSTTEFASYEVEYRPSHWDGFGTGYQMWYNSDQPQWRLGDTAMKANPRSMISDRPVTGEPMSILLNLFMSENFGTVNLTHLVFPSVMRVDYVRIYQLPEHEDITCSPELFPTADYIARHAAAYNDPNITTWEQSESPNFPKNKLIDTC